MSRTAVFLAVGLAALPLGCRRQEVPEEAPASVDADREQVRNFWKLSREANRLRLAEDYEAAIEAFEQALELDPSHEDSLFYVGVSLEQTGEYARAEQAYRRILEFSPASNRAVSQLAALLALVAPGSRPNFGEARELLERSIQINREHSGPYLRLGQLALAEEDYPMALEHFETAAGFGSAEGDLMAGLTLQLQGDRRAAETRFREVIAAAAQERSRAARGEKAEGDVRTDSGALTSPLQSAGARARALLQPSPATTAPVAPWRDITESVGLPTEGGRAVWFDYDADGWTDVLLCGPRPLRLYRNATGRFERVSVAAFASIRDVWDATWGDIDSDGDPDLYLIRPGFVGTGPNQLLRNDGGGVFIDVTSARGLGGERSTTAAVLDDLDGDDKPDLVEVGSAIDGTNSLRIYRNQDGKWRETSSDWGISFSGTLVDVEVADFDGDGQVDLFLLPWRKHVVLYVGEGGGRFRDGTEPAGLSGIRGRALDALAVDYDRDSRPDLLWVDYANSASGAGGWIQRLRNTGGGAFELTTAPAASGGFGMMQPAGEDFDGDGRMDLLLAPGGLQPTGVGPAVVLFELARSPPREVTPLPPVESCSNSIGAHAVDIDRDGRMEVFLAGRPSLRASDCGRSYLLQAERDSL